MTVDFVNCFSDGDLGNEFDFDYEETAKTVIEAALDEEKCEYECALTVSFVTDEKIRELNAAVRDVDRVTDVLSFPMTDYPHIEDTDFDPDTGELVLGDIVLSVNKIRLQAEEYGHSLRREYAFLIVHSMLHLLGYDHMDINEAEQMENKQRKILDVCNITR